MKLRKKMQLSRKEMGRGCAGKVKIRCVGEFSVCER